MGRLIDSRGVRYGKLYGWSQRGGVFVHKDRQFLEFLEVIMTSAEAQGVGILYSRGEIVEANGGLVVRVFIYDGLLQNMQKDRALGFGNQGVKLALYEKLILLAIWKFYGRTGSVEFYGLDNRTMTAAGLARYICVKLAQGFILGDIIGDVGKTLALSMEEGNGILIGYRIDCAGRFTRRQRASYKSHKEGVIGVNSRDSRVDFGSDEAVLKYGACSVKVWLNVNRSREEYGYRIKLEC